ncbi:MAG: hypothetical protein QM723_18440 [Myxococcaceae bacterium]
MTARRFVEDPWLRRDSKSDRTRRVEAAYRLGDSLYFYAGYACSEFGDIVLVYEPKFADGDDGDATPFDTGGLFSDDPLPAPIHDRLAEPLPRLLGKLARIAQVLLEKIPLSIWRERCVTQLVHYFGSVEAHLRDERPVRDDPTGRLHHPGNSRRAWTWEIRLHRDHPLFDALIRVWVTRDFHESLRQEVLKLPDAERKVWQNRLKTLIQRDSVSATPHELAQGLINSWLPTTS